MIEIIFDSYDMCPCLSPIKYSTAHDIYLNEYLLLLVLLLELNSIFNLDDFFPDIHINVILYHKKRGDVKDHIFTGIRKDLKFHS